MPPHPSELSAPPPSKPSAAASSMGAPSYSLHLIGDYIGVESCVVDYEEPPDPGAPAEAGGGGDSLLRAEPERGRRRRREPKGRRREYPPPIPLLARTGNLHSHMPWVLRRHYTSDGRLVLTEEKVRHHEYFRARRANGRLTLQLVPLDGDAPYLPTIADDDNDEEEEEEEEVLNPEAAGITIAGDLDNRDGGGGDDDDCQGEAGDRGGGGEEEEEEEEDRAKLASSIAELTVESGGGGMGGGNGAGKCSNYTGISVSPSSSCIFGVPVPVPALRPVHS
ncbi:uncharacterized protein LOC130139758 [Syzygium oleosum]|uniref:uncharacterized protein LOC130139758 n=1 Tax=Syzygium oleosum TaxID=219896 RepID=UPI0024BACA63|nr:uncharacterized protein LOC130139758 [Syzygium oleosum]